MTEFQRSLIVRRVLRIKLQGQWNMSTFRHLKDNELIPAWTAEGREDVYLREACAAGEKGKGKGKGFPPIYSNFLVKRLFWWRANRSQHCILEKLFPNRLCAGQTITLLSLKGPSGHIFKRLEGEGCIFFVCIYVFLWLEMAYLMLISLLRHA